METELFDFHLPPNLIAQVPSRRRDASKLLVLDRKTPGFRDCRFSQIGEFLTEGDVLVINDTRVFKARLIGARASGGRIEVFLLKPTHENSLQWYALVSPGRRVRPGEQIYFGRMAGLQLISFESGTWTVAFETKACQRKIISEYGHVPLPPYIKRKDIPKDINRYQTVYASRSKSMAVAAPTAGFHFTHRLLQGLIKEGVRVAAVTLHVGPGTFKPIKSSQIEGHTVDPEYAELNGESAQIINEAKANGKRIFAVGTTSVRTLESAPMINGRINPFAGEVSLYIKPGFAFRVVDCLITNFHLPKSSLLVLVSAMAGRENVLAAYRYAIENRYLFYSYGDSMLIL